MLQSSVLMLRHLGLMEYAERIQNAVMNTMATCQVNIGFVYYLVDNLLLFLI